MAKAEKGRQPLPPPISPVLLPHLIQQDDAEDLDTVADPEDIFGSALTLIDPLAAVNQHGEPGATVRYNLRGSPPLVLLLSDPMKTSEIWLFAHYVWNSSVLLAECITRGWWWSHLSTAALTRFADWRVEEMSVIELGAGTGLASLVSAQAGARDVSITDYPATNILKTLECNVRNNVPQLQNVVVQGHEWGCVDDDFASQNRSRFDRVLAADTLWLDGAHAALAASMAWFLKLSAEARVWVIAGFHTGRPKVRSFLEDAIPNANLAVLSAWEVDVEGAERVWDALRQDGSGQNARWCVIAIIGWSTTALEHSVGDVQ